MPKTCKKKIFIHEKLFCPFGEFVAILWKLWTVDPIHP